jgi:MFS family permease
MAALSIVLPKIYHPDKDRLSFKEELKIFKELLFSQKLNLAYLSILALNFNLGIITATYAALLEVSNYTNGEIGMIFSVLVLLSILIHYPSGFISDKKGNSKIMNYGLLLVSISFLVLIISVRMPIPILGMIIFGIGHGLIFPTSAAIIKNNTREQNRGVATGTFYALVVAGIAIGAPISGVVFELLGPLAMFTLGIIVPLSISIIIFLIFRNKI